MTSVLLSDDEIFLRTSKDGERDSSDCVCTRATDGDICFFLFFLICKKDSYLALSSLVSSEKPDTLLLHWP